MVLLLHHELFGLVEQRLVVALELLKLEFALLLLDFELQTGGGGARERGTMRGGSRGGRRDWGG